MATIKSYTDVEQSKKLAGILPLENADMHFINDKHAGCVPYLEITNGSNPWLKGTDISPCWSLAALLGVLPEINDVSLKMEKVKAEDGYNGYYYPIEYKDIMLLPYSKNPVDACYEMILKLHELNLL